MPASGSVPFTIPRDILLLTAAKRHGDSWRLGLDALPGRIAAVGGSQHALITAEQLTELRVTRHQRAHLLATGQVRRVGPGVFLLNGAPFTWRTCIAAAGLGVGSDAVVSHRSAAALYG